MSDYTVCSVFLIFTILYFSLIFPPPSPVPKLQWRKVDGLMPSKAGFSVQTSTLTLPELSFDDEGIYECEAYNSEGRDTYQGRIVVQGDKERIIVKYANYLGYFSLFDHPDSLTLFRQLSQNGYR